MNCMQVFEQTLKFLKDLYQKVTMIIIRDYNVRKYSELIDRLKKINLIHSYELCALLLVKNDYPT